LGKSPSKRYPGADSGALAPSSPWSLVCARASMEKAFIRERSPVPLPPLDLLPTRA